MAAKNGAAADTDKKSPTYHVVRVEGETLTIIARDVPALKQEIACDKTVEKLPKAEQRGKYGALLARSFKVFEYEPETKTVLNKREVGADAPAAPAVAADPSPPMS
jgi:hypothetical protein